MEPYEHMAQALALMEHAAFPAGAPGNVVYQQAPETLDAPLVTQLTVIIRNLEAELARAKADADADNAASFETINRLRREVVLWQDQMAALDNALQDSKDRQVQLINEWHTLLNENDALIDLVTQASAFVWGELETDEEINHLKAALAAHEAKYGRRGE